MTATGAAPDRGGPGRIGLGRPLPEPVDEEEKVEEEFFQQGGIDRVRQLLQSVQKSVNKTFAKSPAAGILRAGAGHRTETPNDVQELLNRFTKGQEVLMQIPEKRAEFIDGMESAVTAKGTFDSLLRELGETRSTYQLAEATTAVADTLLSLQDVQSQAEQGVVEFLFTMGRQERKYTATVREHVNQLETVRTSLDKVLTKQKTASETGGPGSAPEKVQRRKQKIEVRRLVFEDKLAVLRKTIPETELQADAAYCQALITMLGQQRSSISAAAETLAELDTRMGEMQALADETLINLTSKQEEESQKRELAVAQMCGPRMVEMLSAPDFAVALAITELCASPGAYHEDGEEVLKSLLRLLDDSDLCVPMLKFVISKELQCNALETATITLFRKPSLAGALCSLALEMAGDGYLKACLTPLIAQISSGEADFEIDPQHLSEDDDLEANIDNLCKAVQWFIDTIMHSCRDAPVLLRALCMHIFNIAGPKQRQVARRVAGALVMDALFCAAIRDSLGCGLVDVAPDLKSQRVLEHVARALSLAVDDAGGEGMAPSVFAVAAISDFALDLPSAPEELVDILMQNRQRLVGEGGIVDQLAGIADFEDDAMNSNNFLMFASQELVEEATDILKLRALISSQDKALSGILHQRGFHVQVEQLQACVRGSRGDGEDGDHISGQKLLPGSNQPAPVEKNTWTETWKGPEEDAWEEGEEDEDAGMFDGEELLGKVISTPDKAAGLGAVGRDRRSFAQRLAPPPSSNSKTPAKTPKTSARLAYQDGQVEDADSMPDSAPERLEDKPMLELLLETETPGSSQRAHVKSEDIEIVAAPRTRGGAAGAVAEAMFSGDEEQERGLLKPRRKFTKTKAVGVSALANVGPQSPETNLDTLNMPPGALEEKDSTKVVGLEASAGETRGVVVDAEEGALGDDLRMELGAGEGWEVAHLDRVKQPALRRTQRTVTIRGRAEEEEEEEEVQEGEMRTLQAPSARAIAALLSAANNKESVREVSRKNKEDSGASGAVLLAEEPAAVSTQAAPIGVGRLFGVGAVFKRNADGSFYVKKVVLGGPADKAGVKVGSRVVSMDGERLYNKTADQLFKIVLGSEGTTLKLALQPSGAGVRAPEQVLMVRRAFIDEGFLNATAIEPLPKGDPAAGAPAGVASWAERQVHAADPAAPGVHESNESGNDSLGIGVTFKKDGDGFYMVKMVSERGGAFSSGLAKGDVVLSIDGHSMHRKSSHELSRSILGPEGTSLTLTVRAQDGTVRDVQVKRLREMTGGEGSDGGDEGEEGAIRKWGADDGQDGEWEGGGTPVDGADWDGQGEVMRLEGDPEEGLVGIGATLVRDSRGLFVVAEVAPPAPDAPQGRSYNLFVGDIIVQVDGIQATGKSVEAVKKLILGPVGSRIEMVMAQGLGGGMRTVRMARHPDTSVFEPIGAGGDGTSELSASERRLRQQIVPAPGAVPATNRSTWSAKSSLVGAWHRTAGSTQVGLTVAHEESSRVPAIDNVVFGGSGCGLRVKDVLHNCSVGRYERIEIGDLVVAVDGVAVAPDADEGILYGPPGSVVTLTVQKAPPDGRVLELLLTRQTATAAVEDTDKTSELDRDDRVAESAADEEDQHEASEDKHQASALPATSEAANGVDSTRAMLAASPNPSPALKHSSATATPPSESTAIAEDVETTSQVTSPAPDEPAAPAPAPAPAAAAAEQTAEEEEGGDATPAAGGGDVKDVVDAEGGAFKSRKRSKKKS